MTTKNSAREIKVTKNNLSNQNISVKVGTSENRNNPKTVYISFSFWAKPTLEMSELNRVQLKKKLRRSLFLSYQNLVLSELRGNEIFSKPQFDIFVENIPDNLNYNEKRNFINFEIYLHTSNSYSKGFKPLSQKDGEREILDKAILIAENIGESDILMGREGFEIFSKNT